MTAIPEPTEEDFEYVAYLKELFSNDQIPFDWIGHPESRRMLRLLSHYQRENERLARQRDVLEKACREHAADYVSFMKIIAANHPDTTESASTEWEVAKEFIDALSGEGGGV